MGMNLLQSIYKRIHERTFHKRLASQVRFPDLYIISVGNLSAGGTGKTPVVQYLARAGMAFHPMAVLRGYRAHPPADGLLVSDGEEVFAGIREAGDEAMLLSRTSGLRVAVGKDRRKVIENHVDLSRLILLDDAFQNPSVYRNHDLVLIDVTIPPEKVSLLPTGKFREDVDALRRASSILLTRTDVAPEANQKAWMETIKSVAPETPVFQSIHASDQELDSVYPEGVNAFCGIGNPEGFYRTLEKSGARINRKKSFPDHHSFSLKEIRELMGSDQQIWYTTEKDFVRIVEIEGIPSELLERIVPLPIRLQILSDRESDFIETVFGPLLDLL